MSITKSLRRRLKELEAHLPEDMEMIAEDETGAEFRITVKEFFRRDDLGFVRVVRGANLKDLDRIIAYMDELPVTETHRKENEK